MSEIKSGKAEREADKRAVEAYCKCCYAYESCIVASIIVPNKCKDKKQFISNLTQ